MTEQLIDLIKPYMVGNRKSSLVRAARVALLSICLAGYLFTGAPLVNAESGESTQLDERVARIEGILEQMNERLLELNHLSDRIDWLHSDINTWNRNLTIAIFSAIILMPVAQSLSKRFIDRE